MKSLKEQIAEFNVEKAKLIPQDVLATMDRATVDLKALDMEKNCLKTGDMMPEFNLPNHNGENRVMSEYLNNSTIVLSFYRGGW